MLDKHTKIVAAAYSKQFAYTCPLEKLEECMLILHEVILFKMSWMVMKPHFVKEIYKNMIQKEQ